MLKVRATILRLSREQVQVAELRACAGNGGKEVVALLGDTMK
ncbi:hypothetical protein C1H76_5923 [Elsinoe australis]|uniref:Uncharacterized protein n=1 Tax=Elsinoe australis TaxID=40998 RepID=A0A4V6DU30_9PEZI|nr:hypothetical protein C1H76_5923 [Elsinoe australis]